MDLLIGCPLYKRNWILPEWFNAVELACEHIGLEPSYVFVLDMRDEESYACVTAHADMRDRECLVVHAEDDLKRDPLYRGWYKLERLAHMTYLRNTLLTAVRDQAPRHFLSLDSDILLHPDAIRSMYDALAEPTWKFDAVGGKCYMGKGTACPSYAFLDQSGKIRRDVDITYLTKVDAIMAMKLMSPVAYNVDYRLHKNGEDIGWSLACREAGVRLGWDGRLVSKHVMRPQDLVIYDKRCGY